ncbi:MAG: metallophosphoesterase [Lachnospiraceae bacterium]|nr:metallophosphoesterase [Lachnospiraceae bacterium]
MALYRIAPVLFFIPLFFYSYFYFRRIVLLIRRKELLPVQKAACAVAALIFTVPAMNVWGMWALVVLHLAATAGIVDIVRILVEKKKQRRNGFWYRICCSGLLPVLMTALVLGYGFLNMRQILETEYTVSAERSLAEEEYRVVFLSDLHFGTTMDGERLEKICERIGESDPDVVILGGDIVDERTDREAMEEAFQILAGIPSGYGIYYIYGNHDKGRYSPDSDFTAQELEQAVADSGIVILEDETVSLNQDLTLTGRRDRTDAKRDDAERASAGKLLSGAEEESYHILVDHQPRYFEKNAEAGYDLMLSGHTHGGQIWPVGLLTELFDRATINYGHEIVDGMDVIVSSGIGGWGYPVRTGCHSEYVTVHITGE